MVLVTLKDEVFDGAFGLVVVQMLGWATPEGAPIPPTTEEIFERLRCSAINEVVYQRDVKKRENFLEEARDALSHDMRRVLGY